jgi:hypothetical protein
MVYVAFFVVKFCCCCCLLHCVSIDRSVVTGHPACRTGRQVTVDLLFIHNAASRTNSSSTRSGVVWCRLVWHPGRAGRTTSNRRSVIRHQSSKRQQKVIACLSPFRRHLNKDLD